MNLNDEQREAVRTIEGPLLILAGAGSGKTTVIQARVEEMINKGIDPENILAVTFTNKAADEMRERISKAVGTEKSQPIWMMTFHSMCSKILRQEIEHTGQFQNNFTILDANDSILILKKIIVDMGLDPKKLTPQGMQYYISLLKNEMVDVKSFQTMMPQNPYIDWEKAENVIEKKIPFEKRASIESIYSQYQDRLKQLNALDFDDLIIQTVQIFLNYPDVLEKYQEKFHYIMVDEYQDTNHVQYVLVKLLAERYRNLGVVGDDNQSIYAFRGSDIRNILEFEKDYPEAKIVKLEQNYRCTPIILRAANEVIARNPNQRHKKLYSKNAEGEKIGYYHAIDERDEARYVVNEIKRRLKEGSKYSDFSVLFRVNHQAEVFEEAFMRASIPYQIVGGQTFYDLPEIRDVISYLRFIQNTNDITSFQRIINTPRRGITRHEAETIVDSWCDGDFMEHLSNIKVNQKAIKRFMTLISNYQRKKDEKIADFLSEFLMESGLLQENKLINEERANERLQNVAELVNIAIEVQNQHPEWGINEFIEFIANHEHMETVMDPYAVRMMTLHAAKGLEFPNVFLIGMEEGMFPYKRATSVEEIEEERRLCYVGITRAKQKLYMTHTRMRKIFGKEEELEPSRFLYEFDETLIDPAFPLMKLAKEA